MKISLSLFAFISTSFIYAQKTHISYELVKTSKIAVGVINTKDITNLTEPLKAIAAFYSAEYGSDCDGINCRLTTALGLGPQGSFLHKEILKKWFQNSERIQKILDANCSLPPSTASLNSELIYLKFNITNNRVITKYKVLHYNHGKTTFFTSANNEFIINDRSVVIKHLKY